MWLECTSYDYAVNVDLIYRWFQPHSSHWANPIIIEVNKMNEEKQWNKPVYWQISEEQLHVIHLQLTYVGVHHELHQHVLDRYYRQQRLNLEDKHNDLPNEWKNNSTLGILKIMSPQWSNFILQLPRKWIIQSFEWSNTYLTTDIPNGKTDVFVFDSFDIKT